MEIVMRPIGVIHSPYTDPGQTPIQPTRSDAVGQVEVFDKYVPGLQDVEGLSHLILLYAFHQASDDTLLVIPFLDDQQRGLFSTRYPSRPNPIGLSIVQLLSRQENILEIQGVDMLDGTPLLDIKPYVPDFDVRQDVQTGWYATRAFETRPRKSSNS